MEKEKEKNLKNKIVETYAADMTRAIDGSEGIYIKKIIDEQEQREKEGQNLSPESQKNRSFMFLGIFLLVLGVSALLAYALLKDNISTVEVVPQFSPLIFLDETNFASIDDLNKDQVTRGIYNQFENNSVKKGGIGGLYLTINKKIIGLREFLKVVAPSVDGSKMNFVRNDFLIGAINNGDSRSIFILLKARSFSDSFDPMRSWEGGMFNDLHNLFNVRLNTETKYLLTKDFEDGIIQNRNARILKDKDGNIVLMYVFIDDTSVLITNSEQTAREMQLRLFAGNIRK